MLLAQFYNIARFYLGQGLWPSVREASRTAFESPTAVLPTASNEFSAPSAALLDLLQFRPWDHTWGSTYLTGYTAAVPGLTDLLGLAQNNPSLARSAGFYPDLFASGRGLGYSPAAEGWLNFGLLGVAAHLLVFGWTIGLFYRRFQEHPSLLLLVLLAGAIPMFALDGLRIHTGAFVYKLMRVYLFPGFLIWLIREMIRFGRGDAKRPVGEGDGRCT